MLVVALVGSLIVRAAIAQPSYVPTSDMENTLQPGDRVLVLKGLASIMGPSRGEVVMLRDPGGWTETGSASPGFGESVLAFLGLAPSVSRDDLVMRVIGLGGDTVACCTKEGKISVNGVALNEPYLPLGMATDQVTFDVTVPDGSLFVMGDNRAASRDSRYHLDVNSGGVPTGSLLGRVGVVLWPLGHAALVRIPHAFARIPDPGTP